jgi:hypothetical protein
MSRPKVFLAYPFKHPEIEDAVREAVAPFADVVVAKDEVQGSHILDKIIRQMNESQICLFDLTGLNVNVILELGMAIGKQAAHCVMRKTIPDEDPLAPEFFSDIKGWDHIRYTSMEQLSEKLKQYLPAQLRRVASPETSTTVMVPVSTYRSEALESLNEAAGQGGLWIPSFVCAASLIVHPSEYRGERFTEDDEREVVSKVRQNLALHFPLQAPDQAVNVNDGFRVQTVLPHDGMRQEYREYYRFRRDGLFVLTRVSPDDIGQDRQFIGSDRVVAFSWLVRSFTAMSRFAAGMAAQYADGATAALRIAGLGAHRLVDDTAEGMLVSGQLEQAHEDRAEMELHGTARDFADKKDVWAADMIAKCLRLLNYPATLSKCRELAEGAQRRLV